MGPLRETKEQRVQRHEKEISRSRIPRLILRPHLPQQQHKVSPASESPFSEEESREFSPAVSELIQYVLRLQDPCPSSSASPDESAADSTESFLESLSALVVDLTPRNPNSAILLSPVETPCPTVDTEAYENRLMRELDFAGSTEGGSGGLVAPARGAVGRQYWSSSFLVDLLAVAAPMVPTVLWAFSTQRGATDPVYNIGALLRGCCVVALHSLRRTAFHVST
uniref:Syntabulin n=1 Tax=Rousettus aegyptiacus TaxID=9407 RepID=A0A7J8C4K9_ROUAE|nr:syntabulin [Rousettus aegyptiacus]